MNRKTYITQRQYAAESRAHVLDLQQRLRDVTHHHAATRAVCIDASAQNCGRRVLAKSMTSSHPIIFLTGQVER
jgi:hypothetical protein